MNELKKTGIEKIVIGEPWGPNTGNFIHATVYYTAAVRCEGSIETVTRAQHSIKVSSFDEILPAVLAFSEKFKQATKGTD